VGVRGVTPAGVYPCRGKTVLRRRDTFEGVKPALAVQAHPRRVFRIPVRDISTIRAGIRKRDIRTLAVSVTPRAICAGGPTGHGSTGFTAVQAQPYVRVCIDGVAPCAVFPFRGVQAFPSLATAGIATVGPVCMSGCTRPRRTAIRVALVSAVPLDIGEGGSRDKKDDSHTCIAHRSFHTTTPFVLVFLDLLSYSLLRRSNTDSVHRHHLLYTIATSARHTPISPRSYAGASEGRASHRRSWG